MPEIEARPLRADDWGAVKRLFGEKGACGGCWCMYWRLPRGGKLWEERKGDKNRRSFQRLVREGRVHAILAFDGEQPIGWCCFGPRGDFPRIERVKALQRKWDEGTWSVVCFYIHNRWRGSGVGQRLLEEATARALRLGATEVEGFPIVWKKDGKAPTTFAYTGVPAMYRAAGFRKRRGPAASLAVYVKR
jgi:GNAT superfamily N-acetyltransferase